MNYKLKSWIVIILFLFTIVLSFTLPKARYGGTDFISQFKIPTIMKDWKGEDVSAKLNVDYSDDRYNFLGKATAYEYSNKDRRKLFFIILDAGNFHYPNICFTSSGFKIRELKKTKFNIGNHTLEAHTLYTEKGQENFLVFYWISIDKKIVPEWVEQKVKQLYFSLFNKKRVGLMIRIDIPVQKDNIEDGFSLAQQFIGKLIQEIPPEQAEYIFGKG